MRNWTGTRVQSDALTVACPYCHAPAGQGCTTPDGPLTAFPAHLSRIRISQKASTQ